MMKISVPAARTYYPASKNEPEYLLCWIPAEALAQLVDEGRVARDILDDYPGGLEIEVSASAFEDVELNLGTSPEAIRQTYVDLLERNALGESGMVDGVWLEEQAMAAENTSVAFDIGPDLHKPISDTAAPGPKMSEGQDARSVMQSL